MRPYRRVETRSRGTWRAISRVPRHGGLTRRVASLLEALGKSPDPDQELRRLARQETRRGSAIRSIRRRRTRATLFEMMRELLRARPNSRWPSGWPGRRGREWAQAQHRFRHRDDRAASSACRARQRSPSSCSPTVGWIAHALEQAAHGGLIRPAPANRTAPGGLEPGT